jgi:hypothetical protein
MERATQQRSGIKVPLIRRKALTRRRIILAFLFFNLLFWTGVGWLLLL